MFKTSGQGAEQVGVYNKFVDRIKKDIILRLVSEKQLG